MDARSLDPEQPLLDWSDVTARLDSDVTQAPDTGGPDRHTCWLTTLNPDGSPHLTPVGAVWLDGSWWFQTGQGTRKGRNIARDPRCALAVATADYDLAVNGVAELITDPATVRRLADEWNAGGWPCEVDESGVGLTAPFNGPAIGPPPWSVYRIAATRAHATGVHTGGATAWTF